MASTAILRAVVSADTATASTKLAAVGKQIDTLGGKGASSMGRLQTAGKLAFAALGAGAIAFGVSSVRAFQESQKVMAQTEAVLKSTGQAAGLTAKDVTGLATTLSKLSGVDDQTVQSMENVLLTFTNVKNVAGKGNDIFNQTAAATLDLSVALGTDLNAAAIQVGKAMQDPITGMGKLQRAGVSFTQAEKDQVKALQEAGDLMGAQKIILSELTTQFGGSAKAAGDTFAGALGKLKTAFGNLQESVGSALIPILQKAAVALTTMVEIFDKIPGPIKSAILVAIALGGALVGLGLVMNTVRSSLTGLGVSLGANTAAMEGEAVAAGGLGGKLALLGPVGIVAAAAMGAMAAHAYTASQNAKALAAITAGLIPKLQAGTTTVKALNDELDRRKDIPEWAKPLFRKGIADAAAALRGEATGVAAVGTAAGFTAGTVMTLAEQQKELQATADAAKLAELGLAGGFLGIQGASLGATAAQQQLAAAHRTVNKLEKDGKKGTADYKAAVMDLRNAQLGAATSQLGLANAVASYIQEQHGGQATQAQAIADIKAYGRQNGLTKGEVNALIAQVLSLIGTYKQVPSAKKTTVSAPHLASVAGRAWDYLNALNSIPRNVSTSVVTNYSSNGAPGQQGGRLYAEGGIIGAAGGAFVTRGPIVIAGEGAYPTRAGRGAEMVLPMGGSGGRYVKQFIGDAVREAGTRGGGPAIHLTQHFHGTVIGNSDEFKRSVLGAVTEAVGKRRSL